MSILTQCLLIGLKAAGVLSLPASVDLSVRPSFHPSVRPYDQQASPRNNLKIIFQIFLKLGWNIFWVNISDKFDGGYRNSFNMHLIDQKVILTSEVIFFSS